MNITLKYLSIFLIALLFTGFSTRMYEPDTNLSWPIELTAENGFVTTLYQPQLKSFEDNILEGRIAFTLKPANEDIIFGAFWFKAWLESDLDTRVVILEELEIEKIHFPDMIDETQISLFSDVLVSEIESMNLEMSLDRILASLDEVESFKQISDQINNEPPTIYVRNSPAVLMLIDGEPQLKKEDESDLAYVVNTPFFIVRDPESEKYFIHGGNFWYSSHEILNGWKSTENVPAEVVKFSKKSADEEKTDSLAESFTEAPELIVRTKASELILIDGKEEYEPIIGTSLLYVSNSESDIIMDINSQEHFILLAGRWYSSKSLQDGNWKFSEPGDLPPDFEKIPDDSDMASVLPSIPGTPEAETALLEQAIPQTATIDRKKAKVEVKYDGDPQFEKIEGTDISYALNTDKTVLKISNTYYCVDDAVWFVSDKASGPWKVCVERPDEVDQIPPEAPVYNVKYTYIYDSTPDVVYVGYLPGYTYSYVYNGVVVYGTGYYYQSWYGHYYYPGPVTWGYGVHYNPWTGWGFTYGYSYGWVSWGFHPYSRAYWGPYGYRGGYRHGYHRGYRHGYNSGYRAGYAAGKYNANRNVYNNRNSRVQHTGNSRDRSAPNNMSNKARPSGQTNNMYSDRNGNVYERKQNGTYENKSNRPAQQPSQRPGQQPTQRPSEQPNQRPAQQPSQQPSQQPAQMPSQQPANTQQRPSQNNQQQMDRSYQNRNQGTQNYNRSQQQMQRSGSGSRPSGGGGGRRR